MFFFTSFIAERHSIFYVFSSNSLTILYIVSFVLYFQAFTLLVFFFPIQLLSVDICTKTLLTFHHSFQTSLYIVFFFAFLPCYIKRAAYLTICISTSTTHTSLNILWLWAYHILKLLLFLWLMSYSSRFYFLILIFWRKILTLLSTLVLEIILLLAF